MDHEERIKSIEADVRKLQDNFKELNVSFRIHEAQCVERWLNNQTALDRLEKRLVDQEVKIDDNFKSNSEKIDNRFGRLEKVLFGAATTMIVAILLNLVI